METRTRKLGKEYDTYTRFRTYFPHPDLPSGETGHEFLSGFQKTESEGHPISRLSKRTGEDIGGEFKSQKAILASPIRTITVRDRPDFTGRHYIGPGLAARPSRVFETARTDRIALLEAAAPFETSAKLASLGATAISRTVPTNPVFSAAAFLGELREGLPSIPGRSLVKQANPKGAAGEYLNLEFGIKPLISDAKKFLKARETAETRLNQLYRDSGRLVRRRYSFPPEESTVTTTTPGQYLWGTGWTAYIIQPGVLTTTVTTTVRTWFSGGYTFYFPKQEGYHRAVAELEKTFGIIPDVEDLYQLTPWSWAVDWFSNLGDVVANVKSFSEDSLVLRYGYLMQHRVQRVKHTWVGKLNDSGSWTQREISNSYVFESKRRIRATPYGFGVNFGELTPRQLAIISALGISRAPR